MLINLVLQSFGKESEYRRAIFTVLSFFAYSTTQRQKTSVVLFTDNPDFFKKALEGIPITYVHLHDEKIREMRGSIDFLHRIKIRVIEEAFKLTMGNLLYADSDTFFIADPLPLLEQLNPGKSFMHLWEYRFGELRNWPLPAGKTFRDFLKLIEDRSFELADGTSINVSPQHVSWNAGVMMFHSSHVRFLPDVFTLTDQFYPASRNHASEQYAFSVVMQNNTEVQPCDSVIYHYWYRVKKRIIDLFLAERLNNAWAAKPLSERLQDVGGWCRMLPGYFEQHILTLQDNAIQSFNSDNFSRGYGQALKAVLKAPYDLDFIKNVLYHSKRRFINKKG